MTTRCSLFVVGKCTVSHSCEIVFPGDKVLLCWTSFLSFLLFSPKLYLSWFLHQLCESGGAPIISPALCYLLWNVVHSVPSGTGRHAFAYTPPHVLYCSGFYPCVLVSSMLWHVGSRWDGGRGSLDRVDYRPPPPPPGAHNVGNLLHMAGGICVSAFLHVVCFICWKFWKSGLFLF